MPEEVLIPHARDEGKPADVQNSMTSTPVSTLFCKIKPLYILSYWTLLIQTLSQELEPQPLHDSFPLTS